MPETVAQQRAQRQDKLKDLPSSVSFATIFAPSDEKLHMAHQRTLSDVGKGDPTEGEALIQADTMRHSSSSTVLELGLDNWRQSAKQPLTYKLGNSTIRFQKPLVAAVVVILLGVIVLTYLFASRGRESYSNVPSVNQLHEDHFHDSFKFPSMSNYNSTYPLSRPTGTVKGMQYRIAVISDLDEASKVDDKSNTWRSYFKKGYLYWDAEKQSAELEWDEGEPVELRSSLSTGGRGMELSELIVFNGKLYSVDDRTGVVYQIKGNKVVPWLILPDGNGEETKGFKAEWCAVKDEHLYVGGLGKEWTTPDGDVLNFNPMFVKRISPEGHVEHLDWHESFIDMRRAVGIEFPGYMIHEAAAWSPHFKKWFFLPRRASKQKYNDVDDEVHGTNMLLISDEKFAHTEVKTVGDLSTPSHGFSTFKFIPETNDQVIVALKSEELKGQVATFAMVFKVDGTILVPETKIGDRKYEGIEFI